MNFFLKYFFFLMNTQKSPFLKDMEEAKFHNQAEFDGFGSIRPSADNEVKQTPLDY